MARITIAHTCTHCGKPFKRRIRDGENSGRGVSCPHCGTWQPGHKAVQDLVAADAERKRKQAQRSQQRRQPVAAGPAEEPPAPTANEPPPTKIAKRPEKVEEEKEPEERHAGFIW